MANTRWFFGGPSLELGPCMAYVKSAVDENGDIVDDWEQDNSDNPYVSLGKNEFVKVMQGGTEAELKSAQDGDQAAAFVRTSDTAEVEIPLGQASPERLEKVFPGISIQYWGDGTTLRQIKRASQIGAHSDKRRKYLKLVKFAEGNVESTRPEDIFYILCMPKMESVESQYDVGTQRFWGSMFYAFANENVVDADEKPCIWWTEETADPA